jgi:hypothetical protein
MFSLLLAGEIISLIQAIFARQAGQTRTSSFINKPIQKKIHVKINKTEKNNPARRRNFALDNRQAPLPHCGQR